MAVSSNVCRGVPVKRIKHEIHTNYLYGGLARKATPSPDVPWAPSGVHFLNLGGVRGPAGCLGDWLHHLLCVVHVEVVKIVPGLDAIWRLYGTRGGSVFRPLHMCPEHCLECILTLGGVGDPAGCSGD